MNDTDNFFKNRYRPLSLGRDLEEKVWARIGARQKRHKTLYFATAGVAAAMALIALITRLPLSQKKMIAPVKEEVAVRENLYFATWDNQNNYSLEQIAAQTRTQNRNRGI